jgi:hypothetical protein
MENIDRFYANCIFLGLIIGVFVFSAQFVINALDPALFSNYDIPNEISGKDIILVTMGMIFVALTVPFFAGFYSIVFTVYELPKEKAKFLTGMPWGRYTLLVIFQKKKKFLSITLGVFTVIFLVNVILTIGYIVVLGQSTPIQTAYQSITTSSFDKLNYGLANILFGWVLLSIPPIIFGLPVGLVIRKIRESTISRVKNSG